MSIDDVFYTHLRPRSHFLDTIVTSNLQANTTRDSPTDG